MKHFVLIAALFPMVSFAGPTERKVMTEQVEPAVTKLQETYSKSCGCALQMTIDKSVASVDDLQGAKHLAEEITTAVVKSCVDAEAKKAICKMTTLKVAHADKVDFALNGNVGTAGVRNGNRPSWEMIEKILDK